MCHNNDFSLSEAINKFILMFAGMLNVSRDNIILAGGSKGGTAVLYYAFKFGYKHAISIVPQFSKLADFLLSNLKVWHMTYQNMFGSENITKQQIYSIIESAITESPYINYVNLYLLRSDNDKVDTCIELVNLLKSFKDAHCNELVINSQLAYQHDKVSAYSQSLIKGLISVISYGFTLYISKTTMTQTDLPPVLIMQST